jgi:glycosyltransferase involved in cell wall biosynthesis
VTSNKQAASNDDKLRVAICGIRGIPACYGGFETFAEEMSWRLAERGHSVLVYGRSHVIDYQEDSYRGVDIRLLPAPQHKYLETPVHTIRCLLDLIRNPVDVVLVCNAANSPFVWLARLRGMPVAVNLDGIERHRKKWNALGRLWYRLGELCSVLFASKMIADADVIRDYYRSRYFRDSDVIRYGCMTMDSESLAAKCSEVEPMPTSEDENALFAELGLRSNDYILYVSRLEPENNAHTLIEAYERLPEQLKEKPLLIVGDAPYSDSYKEQLRSLAGPRVIFAGYRFGDAYKTFQKHAYCYVQATEVGGTHPALVEAMGFANCIIANGTPENIEVLSDAGMTYAKNDVAELSTRLEEVLSSEELVLLNRKKAISRAQANFDWGKITSDYEALFRSLR